MVSLDKYDDKERQHLLNLPCPTFESTPFVTGTVLKTSRVALISTAGLHRKTDRPFGIGETGYRVIPNTTKANDLLMSHVSTNFDRTGFQLDLNTIFPIDRLNELVEKGRIGSAADFHYSFMGATDPTHMEQEARSLAAILKQDQVNVVVLVPV